MATKPTQTINLPAGSNLFMQDKTGGSLDKINLIILIGLLKL